MAGSRPISGRSTLLPAAKPHARDQLLAAGREQLVGLLDGWEPEQDEELQPVLQRLAGALVVEDARALKADYTSVCRGA